MKPFTKTLLLWGLLIVLFLAIWQFLTPPPGQAPPPPRGEPTGGSYLNVIVLSAVTFAVIFALRRFLGAARVHDEALRASYVHLTAGRFDEAERALSGLSRSRLSHYRRAFHGQRALIALERGDLEAARSALEAVWAEPVGRLFRAAHRRLSTNARGLRALVRASTVDTAGAREDIAAVRADPEVLPSVLARVALAEARVLDEEGDRDGLAALLDRARPLVLEATASPRERALFRAYEAMVEAGLASIYRQKGDRVAQGDEAAAIAAWVARVAPNAAPFVRAASIPLHGGSRPVPAEAASDEARRKVEAARPRKVKAARATKTVGLWAILIMLFAGIYAALSTGNQPLSPVVMVAGFAGVFFWVARNIRRSSADAKRITGAVREIGAGDLQRAERALAFTPEAPLHKAQAEQLRAEVALRRGDMAGVLAQTDLALVALAQFQGGKVTPPVPAAPGKEVAWDLARCLAAERAVALAALGRADEAWAEVAWAQGFPDPLPVFHVALAARLSARDYAGAASVVEAHASSLTLPARSQTLAEVACFVGRPSSRTLPDAGRLRAELRRDRDTVRWIEGLAPGLPAAFEEAAAETEGGAQGDAASASASARK
jgi:hypothetical protein